MIAITTFGESRKNTIVRRCVKRVKPDKKRKTFPRPKSTQCLSEIKLGVISNRSMVSVLLDFSKESFCFSSSLFVSLFSLPLFVGMFTCLAENLEPDYAQFRSTKIATGYTLKQKLMTSKRLTRNSFPWSKAGDFRTPILCPNMVKNKIEATRAGKCTSYVRYIMLPVRWG